MRNKFHIYIAAVTAMSLMFIVGLVLIFTAPSLGLRAANSELLRHGGFMDTGLYHIILTSSITSYNTGGFVLSLIGGLGLLVIGGCGLKLKSG